MFVDRIKVQAQAGNGGRGSVSFRREKFVPKGGPDGGDGGRGGDIILRADVHADNLANFFYEPIIKAKKGENGMGKNSYGRGAKPKIVPVPVGTLVYRLQSAEARNETESAASRATFMDLEKEPESEMVSATENPQPEKELLADLSQPDQEFLLCK